MGGFKVSGPWALTQCWMRRSSSPQTLSFVTSAVCPQSPVPSSQISALVLNLALVVPAVLQQLRPPPSIPKSPSMAAPPCPCDIGDIQNPPSWVTPIPAGSSTLQHSWHQVRVPRATRGDRYLLPASPSGRTKERCPRTLGRSICPQSRTRHSRTLLPALPRPPRGHPATRAL